MDSDDEKYDELYFIKNYNMDLIFEEIFNKLKRENDTYISSKRFIEIYEEKIDEKSIEPKELSVLNNNNLNNINDTNRDSLEIILKNGLKLYLRYKKAYLKDNNNTLIILFLIKANFIDYTDKNILSYWVCSLDFLIEKIKNLGYNNAKITKNITLISNKEKVTNDSSSPSIEDFNENLIIYNDIILKKDSFNSENIFKKSFNYLNLAFNLNNIDEYRKDLHIDINLNKNERIYNFNFLFDLREYIKKMKFEGVDYYLYNAKSGITFSILQFFEDKRKMLGIKYFYFNTECLLDNFKQKRKYFLFQIAKLYKNDQKEEFNNFYQQIKEDLIKYKFGKIIIKISNNFKKIFIIFDNIKNKKLYNETIDIISRLNYINNKILVFIQISEYFREFYLSDEINYKSLKVNSEYFMQNYLPEDYFYSKVLKNNFNNRENEFNFLVIDKNDLKFLSFFIKLMYSCFFSEKKLILSYNEFNYLKFFLKYIFLDDFEEIQKYSFGSVKFRTNLIKESITNYFYSILCYHLNQNDFFKNIKTNSNKGIFIEKQIIFFLISKYLNLKKINIDKIYCFNSDINIDKDQNEIFFFQNLENAPLYDFAILKTYNNILTLKVYQIGINKSYNALKHLNKEKINIDLRFFIQKINKKLDNKIKKFCFGIITTKEAYDANLKNNNTNNNIFNNEDFDNNNDDDDDYNDLLGKEEENENEYKNYKIMKNFCKKNNFEFLIFEPKKYDFYIENDLNLQKIIFNNYIDDIFCYEINKNYLFTNDDSLNIYKLPPLPSDKIQDDRKIVISELKKKFINVKKCDLIAKFFFDGNNNGINFINLINDNYLLYQKKDENNQFTIYYKNNEDNYISNNYQTGKNLFVYHIILSKKIEPKKIDFENIKFNINNFSNINNEEIKKNDYLNKKRK